MDRISRWELAGVPASMAFVALYELGALSAVGLSEHHIPHLMVLTYLVVAGIRAAIDRRSAAAKTITPTKDAAS